MLIVGDLSAGPFKIEKLKAEDLNAGIIKSSWLPKVAHPSIPKDQLESLAGILLSGVLQGFGAGAFNVSDEWNKLLPDFEFTPAEPFLGKAWENKE